MAVKRIEGGSKADERGTVRFVNDFDMAEVRRFYLVENAPDRPFRGWIGHRVERKWFCCLSGSFRIHLVEIEKMEAVTGTEVVESFSLDADRPSVLAVPGSYAIGIESMEPGARLIVFSDRLLGELADDTWRWPKETWTIPSHGV